jgi:TonB family protein
MYGVEMNLPKEQLHELISVIGDHASSEEEWLRACHLLGDHVHKPRRATRSTLVPIIVSGVIALGVAMPWYNHYVDSYQSSDWVPPPPPPVVDGDLNAYLHVMKNKIENRLLRLVAEPDSPLAVDFLVDKYGEVSDIKILKSSGDVALDAFAIDAVRQCGQFDPPPAAMARTMEVQLNLGKDRKHRVVDTL